MPTLVLWGVQDTWIDAGDGERFVRAVDGAVLVTYEDLGHIPMEEDPRRTAADVRAFLAGGLVDD